MQSMGISLLSNPTSWATTFVAIAGLTKLPFPGRMRDWVDMTALDSPDNWEEGEKALLKKSGEIECEYNTSETRLEDIDDLVDEDDNAFFKIMVPGFTKHFWFKGAMLEHNAGEANVGTPKVTGKFKLKIVGPIYFQTSAPS